jgi:hypothetical protein
MTTTDPDSYEDLSDTARIARGFVDAADAGAFIERKLEEAQTKLQAALKQAREQGMPEEEIPAFLKQEILQGHLPRLARRVDHGNSQYTGNPIYTLDSLAPEWQQKLIVSVEGDTVDVRIPHPQLSSTHIELGWLAVLRHPLEKSGDTDPSSPPELTNQRGYWKRLTTAINNAVDSVETTEENSRALQ